MDVTTTIGNTSSWSCYVLMACITRLEQVLDDGYLGARVGSEL
jgi:hypothetical protein